MIKQREKQTNPPTRQGTPKPQALRLTNKNYMEKTNFIELVEANAEALKIDGLNGRRLSTALYQIIDFVGGYNMPFEDITLSDLSTLDTRNRRKYWESMSFGASFLAYNDDLREAYEADDVEESDELLKIQAENLAKAWEIVESLQRIYKQTK